MGFSPLANMNRRIPDVGRSNARNAKITGFGIHHNAGVNAYGQATVAGREVSANYWITNEGDILPNVDENRRAWTSGHRAYPAGAQADHRNITVEVSNSPEGVRTKSWKISDAALKALINLIADVYKRHNLGPVKRGASKGVGVHRDWVATECPGGYIMDKLPHIISEAEKIRSGKTASEPSKPTTPTKPSTPAKKSVATLAREVMAGSWGNDPQRSQKLKAAGYNAAAVQAEVNRLLGIRPATPAKKPAPKPATPAKKSVATLAKEVLDGKWGNDPQRSQRLRAAGYNSQAVQAEVNRLLGIRTASPVRKPAPKKIVKSVTTLAKEVWAGKWGNDPQRSQRLRAAGYDPKAVQREVNRLYY